MYECSKSNGNIVVMTKNTCYFRLDPVWNIHVETTENSISRFLDFNIFWGSNLPQETHKGSRLWRSQYFPLLRNIRISTNTSSQSPATRLPSRSSIPAQLWSTERYNFSSEQFRQLFNSSNHSRSSLQSLHSKLRASSFSPDRQIERRLWNNLTSESEVTQRFDHSQKRWVIRKVISESHHKTWVQQGVMSTGAKQWTACLRSNQKRVCTFDLVF